MGSQRISSRELYILRNIIPIDWLIETMPSLSGKKSEGHFRFRCPLCAGFNTATNHNTNLARCFSCNRNFNTIDLVMAAQRIPFKDAVALLASRYRCLPQAPKPTTGESTTPCASPTSASSFSSIRQVLECALAKTRQ